MTQIIRHIFLGRIDAETDGSGDGGNKPNKATAYGLTSVTPPMIGYAAVQVSSFLYKLLYEY